MILIMYGRCYNAGPREFDIIEIVNTIVAKKAGSSSTCLYVL